MRGSDPSDRDLAAQIELLRRSNLVRSPPIGWLRAKGRAGAAQLAGLELPSAALLDSSPDFIKFDALRVISTKVWVRGARSGMRNPPEHSSGLGGALRRGCTGGSGSARRDSPACALGRAARGYELGAVASVFVRRASASQGKAHVGPNYAAAWSAMAGSRRGSPVICVPAPRARQGPRYLAQKE
jgi:hypothetical protein